VTTQTIYNAITDELRETFARRILVWPEPGDGVTIFPTEEPGRFEATITLGNLRLTPALLDGLDKAGAKIVQQTLDLPPVLIGETGETPFNNKESDMTASENILKVLDDETAELSKGGYAATLVAIKDEVETRLDAVCGELGIDPSAADQFGEDEGGA
jgi:hypothetical protein